MVLYGGHSIEVVGDWVDTGNGSCGDLARRRYFQNNKERV